MPGPKLQQNIAITTATTLIRVARISTQPLRKPIIGNAELSLVYPAGKCTQCCLYRFVGTMSGLVEESI
jgi:hypothetical protein